MKLLVLRPVVLGALGACFPAAALTLLGGGLQSQVANRPAVRTTQGIASLHGLVENKGQWEEGVRFHARAGGIGATLMADALVLQPLPELREPDEARVLDTRPPLVIRLPRAARALEGESAFPTKHHFFVGERRASNALGYVSVLYREIAPGIDLRVRIAEQVFNYDLIVEPGARLDELEFAVEGASAIERTSGGVLAMHTPFGLVEQRIGQVWQEDALRVPESLAAEFRVVASESGTLRYGFAAPAWDVAKRLVIDPGLVYATYIGGTGQELLQRMEVAPDGSTYLLARINAGSSPPTTPSSYQPQFSGTLGADAWVGKLSADGTALEWATFVGGTAADRASGLALAPDGAVVLGGSSWSIDFPVTSGCLQSDHGGPPSDFNGAINADLFAAKLSADGAQLLWATLYGNAASDLCSALVVLANGDVVIAADVDVGAAPFPGTAGALDPVHNSDDQMLLRISADGSTKVFHTYFRTGRILDMATDADSNIYFCGDVPPTLVLPTTPGVHQPLIHPTLKGEAYVTKLDASGAFLHWSTYLGGAEGTESAWGIALDASRTVYVAGQTNSDDFPTTPAAIPAPPGIDKPNGFVSKLLPDASALAWSTYLGGTAGSGYTRGIAVDVAGNAHVYAASNESNWPVTPDAIQPDYIGAFPNWDAYFAKLDAFGEQLVYATWFGGSGGDSNGFVGVDANGRPHIAFETFSGDVQITPGVHDSTYAGEFNDLVVAAFDLPLLAWRVMPGALKGAQSTPNLAGEGELAAGEPTRLSVRGAPSSTLAWGVVGVSQANLPLLGGTLVPFPDLVTPLPKTDAQGALDLHFDWPGFTSGAQLYFQVWTLDLAAPQLFSATNAVMAISQ